MYYALNALAEYSCLASWEESLNVRGIGPQHMYIRTRVVENMSQLYHLDLQTP